MTIKKFRERDVYFIKPDKSSGIVIINKDDYNNKIENHIKEGPYKEIKDKRWKDNKPLNMIQNAVTTLLEKLKNKYDI